MDPTASPSSLFTAATRISRFWLPSLLDEMIALAPSLTGADNSSLYLLIGDRLELAATTRTELRRHLFQSHADYSVNPESLRLASEGHYAPYPSRTAPREIGLTGWVCAFDKPLNVPNLLDEPQRKAYFQSVAGNDLPLPVWSERNRRLVDSEGARPILIVPVHGRKDNRPIGALRATTFRSAAPPFTAGAVARLQGFADSIGAFLEENTLLEPRLSHYFRIWCANDLTIQAREIAEAVPALFGVEACSLFLRDIEGRFLLATTALHRRVGGVNRTHFESFRDANVRNLFYQAEENAQAPSKTGFALSRNIPTVFRRAEPGSAWACANAEPGDFGTECGGSHLAFEPDVRCEFPVNVSKTICLVPVPDKISYRHVGGIIRVVSTRVLPSDEEKQLIAELDVFAGGLAGLLSKTSYEQRVRAVRDVLLQRLGSKAAPDTGRLDEDTRDDLIAYAASLLLEALDANAVTIFISSDKKLKTSPRFTALGTGLPASTIKHFENFRSKASTVVYPFANGRTGWVAANNAVLNLPDLRDKAELNRLGISETHGAANCELDEAGAYIAAPISEGPHHAVHGAVRAVRHRRSGQGSFSAQHESILLALGPVLSSIVTPPPTRVIVSYPTALKETLDDLEVFLRHSKIELCYLEDRSANDAGERFRLLAEGCNGGIVIWPFGDRTEIAFEYGWIQARFGSRHVVLALNGVAVPSVRIQDNDGNVIRYGANPGDIKRQWGRVLDLIRTWG